MFQRSTATGSPMAKTQYSFAKQQREMAKRKKAEEKRERRRGRNRAEVASDNLPAEQDRD